MKKKLFQSFAFFSLTILCLSAYGQAVVTSAGTVASSSAAVVSYSVGEIAVQHNVGGGYILDEGVIIPYVVEPIPVEGIHDAEPLPLNLKVYPNPANDYVNVQLDQAQGALSSALYDVQGRCLKHSTESSAEWTIDFKSLPKGVYFLRVSNGQKQVSQYRIIKNK